MRVLVWKKAEARRVRRLGAWTAREDARLAVGTGIGFAGFHDLPVDGDVAVATDSPWVLAQVGAPTRIATYGDTPAAMEVLVDVLLGRAKAPGSLPVKVARMCEPVRIRPGETVVTMTPSAASSAWRPSDNADRANLPTE